MSGRRARALRAVFSSHDIWLDLSEVARDEWRGNLDRTLGWLHPCGSRSPGPIRPKHGAQWRIMANPSPIQGSRPGCPDRGRPCRAVAGRG
jgi:hypothetical protein